MAVARCSSFSSIEIRIVNLQSKSCFLQAIYTKIISYKSEILNFFKWISVPIVFIALYYQLFVQTDYKQAWTVFTTSFSPNTIGYLLLAILLMPVNLSTEAIKWKVLLNKLHNVSFKKSVKSLLAGIAVSIFTPKRLGEYGGRVLILKKNKLEAVGALFVGNIAQSIANLVVGLCTIFLYAALFTLQVNNKELIIGCAILFSSILLLLYFNLQWVVQWLTKLKWVQKHLSSIELLNQYNTLDLLEILFYSVLKYFIFILQFVLIINAFGIDIQLIAGIICASSVFFIKTMLPVPATVELAARGSIAIFFFSVFTENHIGILVASIILWVINLALPSIVGSFIIAHSKS